MTSKTQPMSSLMRKAWHVAIFGSNEEGSETTAGVDLEQFRRPVETWKRKRTRSLDNAIREGKKPDLIDGLRRNVVDADRLLSLIDSAGEAKVENVDPWATLLALADALDIDYAQARKLPGKPSEVYLEAARRKFGEAPAMAGVWRCACGDCNAPNEVCCVCNQSAPTGAAK